MTHEPEFQHIRLQDIDLGDRARQDYKDVDSLWHSISQRGLIHPIALMPTPEGEKPYLLLCGGRRFVAHVFGGALTIPARLYEGGLSDLERKEIELIENLEREDLSYDEEAALVKEIDELEAAIHGRSRGPEAGHSMSDTARLLKRAPSTVQQDIELANAIEQHPELGKKKNKAEAKRALRQLKKDAVREMAVARHQAEMSEGGGDRMRDALINCYFVGDFFDGVRKIPPRSMHLAEVDPPYAIDLQKTKQVDTDRTQIERYNEIPASDYPDFLRSTFESCYNVLQDDAWLICWFAIHPWYETVLRLLRETGFDVYGLPALWYKSSGAGQTRNPELRLGSDYEPFFYARKGNAVIMQQGKPNVFTYTRVPPDRKIHPTERPVEMMNDIIGTFCPPGGNVLVPFAGSGNSLLAANNLGMKPIGFDLTEECHHAYAERVLSGTLGGFRSYG